jgi:hypothetical protein
VAAAVAACTEIKARVVVELVEFSTQLLNL